jgi:hypothetical protein
MDKQLNLPLLPPIASPTIRDIQIATRGMNLFDFQNRFQIIESVAKCYGIDIINMPANTKGAVEFMDQCYKDALIADSAYNPDKRH